MSIKTNNKIISNKNRQKVRNQKKKKRKTQKAKKLTLTSIVGDSIGNDVYV